MPELNCPKCNKPCKPGMQACAYCGFVFPFSTDMLEEGTLLQGRYEIRRLIHSGGMGYVYLAEDKRLDRQIVIKQVKQTIKSKLHLEQLEKEALNMAQLNHSNVAMILDHFTENNFYFLVVEYVRGRTLAEIFDERGQNISEADVIRWMIPVCDAVAYMHGRGLVHRDISPDNIMLTPDGHIKMVDFGTLHELSTVSAKKAGKEGKFGFTPAEQWQGNPVPQSDIFTIGATIYYLLTGYLPVSNECRTDGKPQPQDYSPVYPPARTINTRIGIELEGILGTALQPEVTKRYRSIEELARLLKNINKNSVTIVVSEELHPRPKSNPELFLPQSKIDFGYVKTGEIYSKNLSIVNKGEEILCGKMISDDPALSITPSSIYQPKGEFSYKLAVDTSGMAEFFRLASHIFMQTNAGNRSIEVHCASTIRQEKLKKNIKYLAGGGMLVILLIIAIVMLTLTYQASQAALPPTLEIKPATGNIGTTYTVIVHGLKGSGYDYSVIEPDGKTMPQQNITCTGSNGNFQYTIPTVNSSKLGKYRFIINDTRMKQPYEVGFWIEPASIKEAKLAYSDNLNSRDKGWFTGKIMDNSFSCETDGYVITIPPEHMLFQVDFPQQCLQKEFSAEVNVTRLSKAGNEICGLVYRKQDADNYSAFLINNSNKTYCVVTVAGGNWYPRGNFASEWISCSEINETANAIKIVASEAKIYFYINGKIVKGVADDQIETPRNIGIAGGTQSGKDAVFKFNNLKLYSAKISDTGKAEPVFTVVPGGTADLVITQIWIDKLYVHYKIKNTGGATSEPSKSYLFVNNFKCDTSAVNILVPGQEESLYFSKYSWPFIGSSFSKSINTIKVKVHANYENGGLNFKEIVVNSMGKYNENTEPFNYTASSTVGKVVFIRSDLENRGISGQLYTGNAGGSAINKTDITFCRYPMFSPDSTKIAYMKSTGADNWDIYVRGLTGDKAIRLTTGPAFDGNPSWSPDGEYITYTSSQGTISGSGAYINCMSAESGILLYQIGPMNCNAPDLWPYYSLDGKRIIYIMKSGKEWEINQIDLNGLNYYRLGRTPISIKGRPVISPDRNKIAFTMGEGDDSEIYIMDNNGENLWQLTRNGYSDYSPNWSSDGRWVIYSHLSFKLDDTSSEFNAEPAGIYIIDLEGKNNAKINGTTYEDWAPSWR